MTLTWTNETRKLSELKPWERNPRQIKDKQAKRLAESFDTFGQVETIAISSEGEIYNGHQRLSVLAGQHGMDYEVDVRVASQPLTEKEREKLTVFLHRGATGEWSWDELANWDIGELLEWGFEEADFPFDVGAVMGEGVDSEPQINRADELQAKWQTSVGQMWRLPSRNGKGEHRLICGDCTDKSVVDRVMGGDKASATVTDPPYGQNQAGVTNDEPEKLQGIIEGCIKNIPCDNAVIVAFSSPRTFPTWLDALRANGYKFERMLWMYKAAQETFPWRGWLLTSEAILVGSIGNGQWQDVHPYSHDCYYKSEVSGELDESLGWHGSVKPLDVVSDLIARVSANNHIVYEPFSGSGTTIIACENLSRYCRAVEISPAYVAVALERYQSAFQIEPELIN